MADHIAEWRKQDSTYQPLQRLTGMHRIPARWRRLQLVAMPFHPAGSVNYSPPAVYTSLFKSPDLGWVLGHEGSHLLWSEEIGAAWRKHRRAEAAIALAKPLHLDLEEGMCLFMQVELSRICGRAAADYRISEVITKNEPLKNYLAAMEADWLAYLSNAKRWPTLIDYAMDRAMLILSKAQAEPNSARQS